MDAPIRKQIEKIPAEQGLSMGFVGSGKDFNNHIEPVGREIRFESTKRVKSLMENLFYQAYSSANTEFSSVIDDMSCLGAGGGNVVASVGKVISLAGKFGIRAEEVPVLTKLAHEWKGKSVEDLGLYYETMLPDIDLKDDIMKTVLVFCDSGYTIPQGREIASNRYLHRVNERVLGIWRHERQDL